MLYCVTDFDSSYTCVLAHCKLIIANISLVHEKMAISVCRSIDPSHSKRTKVC